MFSQSQEPTSLITNPMLNQRYHKDLTHKLIITMQMVVGVIGIFSQTMAVSFIGTRIPVIAMAPSEGVLENIHLSSWKTQLKSQSPQYCRQRIIWLKCRAKKLLGRQKRILRWTNSKTVPTSGSIKLSKCGKVCILSIKVKTQRD